MDMLYHCAGKLKRARIFLLPKKSKSNFPPTRRPFSSSPSPPLYHNGSNPQFAATSPSHPSLPIPVTRSDQLCHPFDEMLQREHWSQYARISHVIVILRASYLRPDIVTADSIHCLAVKTGALAHLPVATSLLTLYSRAGDLGSSQFLFNGIRHRDVVIWNAMMTAFMEHSCFGFAVDLFVRMVEVGGGFDSTSLLLAISALSRLLKLKQGWNFHCLSLKSGWLCDRNLCNALVDMYAKCGDLSSSETVFVEMEDRDRDVVSWNSVMTGCLHNDYPEKSLQYFKEMTWSGERMDVVSLSCAVAAATSQGEWSFGEEIHALGVKLGFDDTLHNSVSNSLISLYSQSGDTEAAEAIFRDMRCKDIISWNSMIHGFASNGLVLEAFDLMYEMQLMNNVEPDTRTVVSTISLCAESILLKEGRAIHGYVVRQQLGSDLSVTNSLIDMYLKCNSTKKAELLFNTLPNRDLVTWNTMIFGYSQKGQSQVAQELFKELIHRSLRCSLSTLFAILPSCASPRELQFGKSIHCWQFKLGFPDDIHVANSLIHMYIYCGDLTAAFVLLERICAIADDVTGNTVIAGCTRNCHFQQALETFNLMRRKGNVAYDTILFVNVALACGNLAMPFVGKALHALCLKSSPGLDVRAKNALISMYGRCGDVESARLVFHSSSNHNLCSWNCMISSFSQNNDGRRALELFQCLGLQPNGFTIISILSACTQLGLLRHGRQIHCYALRNGFQRNSIVSAALLDMYSNCGRLDIAVRVFTNLEEKAVDAWNSMIAAYGCHSDGRTAIDLFNKMCDSGIKATKSSFVSLLRACSHQGLVDQGMFYYNHMFEKYGVERVTDHHVCMVNMLGQAGKLQEAFDFVKNLQTSPEPGVWGALLTACNIHGDIKLGREVANLLFDLEPQNAGYYITLFNMYVAEGRWKEAGELRYTLVHKQLKKQRAYSVHSR